MEAKNATTFKHPHLSSWNEELSKKIKSKEGKATEISTEINTLKELNNSKENEILSLEKAMDKTLNNVEKYIERYSNGIKEKLDKIRSNEYEKPSERSEALFSLYKELYQDARVFFSRREFKYEPSSLKLELNDKILSWLAYLFEEDYDNSNNWTDVLTPIWSIEYQYADMELKCKNLNKVFKNTTKMYEDKKKIYDKLSNELDMMKKELEALKDFSNKIKECRKNKEQNLPEEMPEDIDANDVLP